MTNENLRTFVSLRNHFSRCIRSFPGKSEIISHLLGAWQRVYVSQIQSGYMGSRTCLDVDHVCLYTNMLQRSCQNSPLPVRYCVHTTSVECSFEELECSICDVSRRMDPIGTGFANEIPSKDKNRTGKRVKSVELVKPS